MGMIILARRKNKLIFQEDIEAENIVEVTDFDIALTLFLRDCKIRNLSEYTLNYYGTNARSSEKCLKNKGNQRLAGSSKFQIFFGIDFAMGKKDRGDYSF